MTPTYWVSFACVYVWLCVCMCVCVCMCMCVCVCVCVIPARTIAARPDWVMSPPEALADANLLSPCRNAFSSCAMYDVTHSYETWYTATYCNTLQHTATHCNTLQHAATRCNILQVRDVRHDSFIRVTLYVWEMTHSYVRHGWFLCVKSKNML